MAKLGSSRKFAPFGGQSLLYSIAFGVYYRLQFRKFCRLTRRYDKIDRLQLILREIMQWQAKISLR